MLAPDFAKHHVVVIGDVMLDRYWYGDTTRISPEAPVQVVQVAREEIRAGGAANVALNTRSLGVKTTLIGAIGEDEAGQAISHLLESAGVITHFLRLADLKTTLKLRVVGRQQQLIRLDFENKILCQTTAILAQLAKVNEPIDILILSDYAKGMLLNPQPIIQYAKSKGIKVLVDPKTIDLTVYQGADILTPNLIEFEAVVGPCKTQSDIEIKGAQLRHALQLQGLLVTRGSQGMTLITADQILHIPTQAKEVFDITGAGDTVIAVLGACLAAGLSVQDSTPLANLAGGITVGRLGTATVSWHELQLAIAQAPYDKEFFSIAPLLGRIGYHKAQGHKIIMTNGCFDLLHPGHIRYLQQARALGDCLIVAVNDDDSIQRLKGPQRPILPLAQRMSVLASLECVDYVIPFSEDTPEDLISMLLPTILVKGGDYEVAQVAGGKAVMAAGGIVRILPFHPGFSTTQIVDRIRDSIKKVT